MNTYAKIISWCVLLLATTNQFAQHHSTITADVSETKIIKVSQQLIFQNDSKDTLYSIVMNDWNNAYSAKNTPLAKRFSDEFVRSFHLAKADERGYTTINSVTDASGTTLNWQRPDEHPDLVEIALNGIYPGEKITLNFTYLLKIPSDRFTKYGYTNSGGFYLKDCFLTPARYENHDFIRYSNNNLDDIASGVSSYDVTLNIPKNLEVESDLIYSKATEKDGVKSYDLNGKDRLGFSVFIQPESPFLSFRNSVVDVRNGIDGKKVDDIQKAIIVDRVVNFVNENIGPYPFEKITVSQADYERNPFYGLSQMPSFLNVFKDEFIYELKFLKTYTNNYLLNTLKLDLRKDHWIFDGFQVWLMMKYIEENHPEAKMTGGLRNFRLLRHYNLTNIPFNDQYSYFYMLMARKNLDQPIGDPKNTLIKFNEQIAGKYRAGLSLKYLDAYLENGAVAKSLSEFAALSRQQLVSEADFESILKKNGTKEIDWFLPTVIHSRGLIDYKFTEVAKTEDKISFTVKNRTGVTVPVPYYGIKNGKVVFKQWLEDIETDSTFTISKSSADKIVLNYHNEVPEFNMRNNWKSLKPFVITNRPVKFRFFKDLEDPDYNQILYVPTLIYNLYDGITPGLRFYNKTLLDKPFTFDINPSYSTNTKSLTGTMSFSVNQNLRGSRLYNIRYYATGYYFHYAPDAAYLKINPTIQMRFRPSDFRDNRKQSLTIREVILNREHTDFSIEGTENYSVFNVRYSNSKTEVTRHLNFGTDIQASAKFGKASAEIQYRKLFDNNRQVNLRLYAGTFLYNRTNTDFFSFALDRPTDYLFDYNYYGRSEESGLFSQQLILAEGGFKSKLDTPYANQWITTLNAGFNIWNWIEVYGDVGLIKSKNTPEKFVYDSGIRLNLVTDYFELYFPVYSNNGWEIAQDNYGEKIRFIVTLSPGTLINLFTRKWF